MQYYIAENYEFEDFNAYLKRCMYILWQSLVIHENCMKFKCKFNAIVM